MPGKSKAQQAREARAIALIGEQDEALPTGYTARSLCQYVKGLALLGWPNEDIAAALDISLSTVQRWQSEWPAFRRALMNGRERADVAVVGALHKAAVGHRVKESKPMVVEGKLQAVETERYFPPSVPAATLWLTNRQRSKWRDAKQVDHEHRFDLGAAMRRSLAADPASEAQEVDGRADMRPLPERPVLDATDKDVDISSL